MLKQAFPAGWPLRGFAIEDFEALILAERPTLVEVSKDFLSEDVSLKELARRVERLQAQAPALWSFAGTTDLTTCGGFSWGRYRDYLAVQLAQARFLGCSYFRVLLGPRVADVSLRNVIERLRICCADAEPMQLCFELHGGIETDLDGLAALLESVPAEVVVDLENVHKAGLQTMDLMQALPERRIAYFHVRNLPPQWIEHPETLDEAERWAERCPDHVFLWEPKKLVDPSEVRRCFVER